jgi:hypothetical protein
MIGQWAYAFVTNLSRGTSWRLKKLVAGARNHLDLEFTWAAA